MINRLPFTEAMANVEQRNTLFVLKGPTHQLQTEGCQARLPAGNTTTLGQRVSEFFHGRSTGPDVLVGALPFDPLADDALYQPARLTASDASMVAPLAPLVDACTPEPAASDYADMVARCVAGIDGQALSKAVLARSLKLQAAASLDPLALAARLERDASVTTYVLPVPVASAAPPAWLVGATPELLISRRGRTIVSHPLAGSARRCANAEQDAAAASALSASTKDLEEHAYVVDAIKAALAPLCSELHTPEQPSLYTTDTMWHLGTRITGTLKDDSISVATLAGLLHPTPAVCGTPRQQALNTIASLEPVDRGFYAGAVGWVNAEGDGDWYVAIRCAHVQANTLRLFAGAGIVADSVPALEVAETGAKFRAMLNALGVDDELEFECNKELSHD